MRELHYQLVDVFTETPFGGNQLAVFPEADDLDTATMQQIARELNLSESAFVFPPKDRNHDAHLRIFTPAMEMPMAGHPTVGTAFVLRQIGRLDPVCKAVFEEGVGPIPVELVADGSVIMQQPVSQFGAVFEDRALVAELLSISADDLLPGYPVQAVSSGVPFLYVPLKTLDALGRAKVRLDLWEKHLKDSEAPSIFAFTPDTDKATVRSRMFAPIMGITEDPATGAASGPLGAYLVNYGLAEDPENIISLQGVEMGRPSQINIRITQDAAGAINGVYIGGQSVYMGEGKLILDASR